MPGKPQLRQSDEEKQFQYAAAQVVARFLKGGDLRRVVVDNLLADAQFVNPAVVVPCLRLLSGVGIGALAGVAACLRAVQAVAIGREPARVALGIGVALFFCRYGKGGVQQFGARLAVVAVLPIIKQQQSFGIQHGGDNQRQDAASADGDKLMKTVADTAAVLVAHQADYDQPHPDNSGDKACGCDVVWQQPAEDEESGEIAVRQAVECGGVHDEWEINGTAKGAPSLSP